MSFTADVEICNLALSMIGDKPITTALLATPGSNNTALQCSKLFEPIRDRTLKFKIINRNLHREDATFPGSVSRLNNERTSSPNFLPMLWPGCRWEVWVYVMYGH